MKYVILECGTTTRAQVLPALTIGLEVLWLDASECSMLIVWGPLVWAELMSVITLTCAPFQTAIMVHSDDGSVCLTEGTRKGEQMEKKEGLISSRLGKDVALICHASSTFHSK